jgi:hypothetical protein
MLQTATSLADFFKKADADDAYKDAAIRAYVNFFGFRQDWVIVKEKLNQWAETNVGQEHSDSDCSRMVEYLNNFIRDPHRLP